MRLQNFLKSLKLQESTISMLVGLVIVVLIGYLSVHYFTNRKTPEILPPLETTSEQETTEPKTHIVEKGESLWTISEKYYGTGYNWVDIKDENKLSDANAIHEGDQLTIPSVAPRIAKADSEKSENDKLADVSNSDDKKDEVTPTETPKEETSDSKDENNDKLSDSKEVEHTVEQTDSLWKIAQKYYNDGNKWVQIAKANNLDHPSIIRRGQKLIVPDVLAEGNGSQDNSTASSDKDNYTVQKGDSLWTIAQGAYGEGNKWTEIAKANNLAHPSVIHAGNKLTIPR